MDLTTIFEADRMIVIAKWAVMILITGFIAQFGKKFAEYLLNRAKKGEKKDAQNKENKEIVKSPEDNVNEQHNESKSSKEELKILKKQEKARQKMLKKQK